MDIISDDRYVPDTDPDMLAEGFLVDNHIWDPNVEDLDSVERQPRYDELHPKLAAYIAYEHIEKGDFTLRFWQNQFYIWQAGRYLPVSDSDMKCTIKKYLHHLNHDWLCNRPQSHVTISSTRITNIMLCLAGYKDVHIPESTPLNTWLDTSQAAPDTQTVAFNNGLLLTGKTSDTPVFRGHSPHYFSLTRLPYDYAPAADCPRWRAFLEDIMSGDRQRIELLCQWAGYLLSPTNQMQKFLLLAGEGRNGKTVFTSTLEKMVGLENVSHIPLCQFAGQFALACTLGKLLNSSSESSHCLDETAETILKSFTSGDRMTFNRKYKEPVHACPTAKIMLSTNQLPQFTDKSSGLWRRLLFVPFENSYPEEIANPHLADELATELPGIFNWAYQGLLHLRCQGRFTSPDISKAAIEQYRSDVNPARAFLLDNYTAGLSLAGIPTQKVYDDYASWCSDNGYKALNANNLGKEVMRTFPSVQKGQKRQGNRRIYIYSGLACPVDSDNLHGASLICH
jgi:putative DNA primase/helicase